ncbi:Peptidase M16 [Gracilaria domingensis]|nr:Peptidase M16 [Gracilaria domingensis]
MDSPKKKGLETRSALLEFYHSYYSANIMKLCIISPHPIDIMQQWVCELFSSVPNSGRELPCQLYRSISPIRKEDQGQKIFVQAIADIRYLGIFWTTSRCPNEIRSSPGDYVARLVEDEGHGGLLNLLKVHGWATELFCNYIQHMTSNEFIIETSLTVDGIDHTDEIICLMFQSIRLIKEKGITRTIYKEKSLLEENAFKFNEKEDPVEFVVSGSGCMHILKPGQYLSGQVKCMEYNPGDIRNLLDQLTPENCRLVISNIFVKDKTNLIEKWYDTSYGVEKIPPESISVWKTTPCNLTLRLPKSNPFIPTQFNLYNPRNLDERKCVSGPRLVHATKHMDIYHKLNTSFQTPKVCILIFVRIPGLYISPVTDLMNQLFVMLVEDALRECCYPARKAGFQYNIIAVTFGLVIHVAGYNHRIDVLLETIFQKLATLRVEPTRFEIQKDILQRNVHHLSNLPPFMKAEINTECLLHEPRWIHSDYLEAFLDDCITLAEMATYSKEFPIRAHITALVNGNILKKSAIDMMKVAYSILQYSQVKNFEQPSQRIVQLPQRDIFYRMQNSNSLDPNSAIEVYFQIGLEHNVRKDFMLELLSEILSDPFYHELRTVQQLGYIVREGHRTSHNTSGIFFQIHSTVNVQIIYWSELMISSCQREEKYLNTWLT